MARHSHIQFSIPEPCSVPWNGMTPVDIDQRYCSSCEKVITDFSKMSDDELMLYFKQSGGNSCGRFARSQLNRPMLLLPEKTIQAKWWRTLLLIPLTLFGKQAQSQTNDTSSVTQQKDSSTSIVGNDSLIANKPTEIVAVSDSTKLDSTVTIVLDNDSIKDSLMKYAWKPRITSASLQTVYIVQCPNNVEYVLGGVGECVPINRPVFPYWDSLREILANQYPPSVENFINEFRPKIQPKMRGGEKLDAENTLKELTTKAPQKPKSPQPAMPASNEISGILPEERKKSWRS